MSATKLRGRARQETTVVVSVSNTLPTITHKHYAASVQNAAFCSPGATAASPASSMRDRHSPCDADHATLRSQPPLDAGGAEDAAGDLLDRALGSVERGDGIARAQRLRGAQLVLHLLTGGVAAVRTALVTDLLQPLGPDGEREQLVAVGLEARWQPPRLQVVLGERVVGRKDTVLQRQVHTRRGL